MHLLLTGVSGFLGSHVAQFALKSGHEVTAIVRVGDKRKFEGIRVIERDLTSDSSLSSDLKHVDVVIHCAADTNVSPRKVAQSWRYNVNGTANLLRESFAAGVRRFIYVSTAATMAVKDTALPYVQSKIECEKMLLKAFADRNFPVVIVNPSFILGPVSGKSGSVRLIQLFTKNRLILHTSGDRNIVDVRDVARAIVNAITMGKPGERYLLINENVSYREIIETVDRVLNRSSISIQLPDWFSKMMGYVGTALSYVSPRGFAVNHVTMGQAIAPSRYRPTSTANDLQFYPRPAVETIIDTVQSIRRRHDS